MGFGGNDDPNILKIPGDDGGQKDFFEGLEDVLSPALRERLVKEALERVYVHIFTNAEKLHWRVDNPEEANPTQYVYRMVLKAFKLGIKQASVSMTVYLKVVTNLEKRVTLIRLDLFSLNSDYYLCVGETNLDPYKKGSQVFDLAFKMGVLEGLNWEHLR